MPDILREPAGAILRVTLFPGACRVDPVAKRASCDCGIRMSSAARIQGAVDAFGMPRSGHIFMRP